MTLHVLLFAVLLINSVLAAEDPSELAIQSKRLRQDGALYRSLDLLEEAARAAPTDYRIHKERGDLLMTLRRNQEAIVSYQEAIRLAPDAREVYWSLWALLDRMSLQDEAIVALKAIIRLDPDNPLAHIRVARALSQLDRLEEAVASFRRAAELAPDQLMFRLLYARALFDVLECGAARHQVDLVLARATIGSSESAAARLKTASGSPNMANTIPIRYSKLAAAWQS